MMTDTISVSERSRVMSLIRAKNTRPEMLIRRLIHAAGYRYRLHGKQLPGKPDLVFASRRKVIFVHGSFWRSLNGRHRWPCHEARRLAIVPMPMAAIMVVIVVVVTVPAVIIISAILMMAAPPAPVIRNIAV